MNDNLLKSLAITLRWENRYRTGEHFSGEGAFLPELHCLDQDFHEALKKYEKFSGKLLEIGTGISQQAVYYAQLGFQVTATDISHTAIEQAKTKAEKQGLPSTALRFVQDNVLMSHINDTFDVVTDRGCFTTLKPWELSDYRNTITRLLKPNGLFLIKVNSGQYDMLNVFSTHFKTTSQVNTFYHGTPHQGPPAGFFVLKPLTQ